MNYLETITIKEKERWNEIVSSFKQHDVYYLNGYVKAFQIHGDGEPLLYYYKIISYNSEDQYIRKRLTDTERLFIDNCLNYFKTAEDYYLSGKYEEAKKLYSIVVNQSCFRSIDANSRLIEITNRENNRKHRVQAILYEYAKNTPIGISAGHYKENKFAGYFSLRLNAAAFESIRKNYDKAINSELNVSFGWTTSKIYYPVWIFFGPGYTGAGEWVFSDASKENPKFKIHSAISPEIGVLGKIGPVALRYTFQYRFALENDYQDHIGSIRHVLGIGVCF